MSRDDEAGRYRVPVAVYGLLERDGHVLLMRRQSTGYRDGELGLPAGHVEFGEDVVRALVRELREELGIDVEARWCRLALAVHRAPETEDDTAYVDLFFHVACWPGEPRLMEPGKCGGLVWAPRGAPPPDVVDYVAAALAAIDRGEPLLSWGW